MKTVSLYLFSSLLSATMLVGCGGSSGDDSTTDDGTSGGGGSTTISLPSNAITLDENNAIPIAQATITYLDFAYFAFGVDAQIIPPTHQVISTVKDIVFNDERRTYSVATGLEDSGACTNGGTYSDTWTETDTSWTGTVTFTNCDEGGVIINGSLNYSESWNDTTGDYTSSADGSITVTFNGESFTMALNISETGNETSGDYSATISYSVSGSNVLGWLVQTASPIVGNHYDGTYASGTLIITGANNTKVRVTVVPTNSATVELDTGSGYAEVANSPISFY